MNPLGHRDSEASLIAAEMGHVFGAFGDGDLVSSSLDRDDLAVQPHLEALGGELR